MNRSISFLFTFIFVILSGCTTASIGCRVEKPLVDTLTPLIATQLQCSNSAAISADLTKLVGTIGLCKPAQEEGKTLPAPICSFLADMVINNLASVAVPSAWGCTAQNAKDTLKAIVMSGCSKI